MPTYCINFLYIDAYTTSYSFSLWDESLFSAHLELSEGDISHEIMKTQLCYEGTVTYDINMLNVSL